MKILILNHHRGRCNVSCFLPQDPADARLQPGRSLAAADQTPESLRDAWRDLSPDSTPDAIGIRALFGGERFPDPVPMNDDTLSTLNDLIPQAALYLPSLIAVLHACRDAFPDLPAILSFESSFFVDLPPRERLYGLDFGFQRESSTRKYGFHGILHQAASREAARRWPASHPLRILSICLDPKPEIAAVLGRRPVMVSGGVTPVEGIPGHTSCGELDPGIALRLAGELDIGPEGIDWLLSRESGLKGLLNREVSLPDVFESSDPDCRQARAILEYRILRSCGAAIAALHGLDGIVFSGRFARLAGTLGPWLTQRLAFPGTDSTSGIPWIEYDTPVEQLVAETALVAALPLGSGKAPDLSAHCRVRPVH